MCLSRRAWLSLVVAAIVAGLGLAQLGATSTRVDAIDLGTLGGSDAVAYAVTSRGHVVGQAETADGHRRAFLWQGLGQVQQLPWDSSPVGEMTDLGALPDLPASWTPEAVNDRDQVVGNAVYPGLFHFRALIWERGQLKDLGALPGNTTSWVDDINAQGQAVGYSTNPVPFAPRPVIWQRGGAAPLALLPGYAVGTARAINDSGVVAGEVGARPVIWRRGVPTELGRLSGAAYVDYYYIPWDINSRGQVVGTAYGPGASPESHCVLWDNGVILDLGMLPGYDKCWATSIDDLGEVVGYVWNSATTSAFIWQSGVMTDLNTYVPPGSGWHLSQANGINKGAIVGQAQNDNGLYRAYKLLW